MSEMFGPYRVVHILAARNQSRIDLVENTAVSNRREVLKRIHVVPNNDDNRDLIEAEKQGTDLQRKAHLRNQHIIDVYSSGLLNEYFFVSMEYVEGQNLEEYQKDRAGPLSPLEAASIAREVCSQVATLHEFLLTIDGKSQAFLHNDIKPSNIQMSKMDNQIRLIDFGAAKTVTYSKNFTRNDFASVAYCSPERLDKGLSNSHTDLWSIAVVLYEMVAGRLPYQASTHQQLEVLITSGAPPARLPETCPAALHGIINKALSASVENRYPTAYAFGEDLQKFCSNPQLHVVARTTSSENATRRVTPPSPNPAPQQPSPNPAAVPLTFTTTPISSRFAESPRQIPRPLASIGSAIRRRPVRFAFRTGLGILAVYLALSGWSAHRQAESFYASLGKQDFPAMPIADIELQSGKLQSLRETVFGRLFAASSGLRTSIKPRLMETAERPINAYRTDQNHAPPLSDWLRARSCLSFATEIDSSDKLARAELDLVDGHLARLHKHFADARQKFLAASSLAPDSSDPWIGLAYLDAYHENNLQALIADQIKEQQHHYTPAQREAAQRGDVSLILGRKAVAASVAWRRKSSAEEETRFLHEAEDNFAQAEKNYEGCRNWFHTEAAIEEIHKRRATIQQRLADLGGSSK